MGNVVPVCRSSWGVNAPSHLFAPLWEGSVAIASVIDALAWACVCAGGRCLLWLWPTPLARALRSMWPSGARTGLHPLLCACTALLRGVDSFAVLPLMGQRVFVCVHWVQNALWVQGGRLLAVSRGFVPFLCRPPPPLCSPCPLAGLTLTLETWCDNGAPAPFHPPTASKRTPVPPPTSGSRTWGPPWVPLSSTSPTRASCWRQCSGRLGLQAPVWPPSSSQCPRMWPWCRPAPWWWLTATVGSTTELCPWRLPRALCSGSRGAMVPGQARCDLWPAVLCSAVQ